MRKILANSFRFGSDYFTTNGGVRSPYFYESDHAIVFPPCSDTEGTGMETITQVLFKAKSSLTAYADKCFLFPLVEERGKFLSWGARRMHWVTLHYDPTTQIATLIDSRPTSASYLYICQPIHEFLNAGLLALDLPLVKSFHVVYQGVQQDDIHCGAWAAVNIERLANGQSLETQLSSLKSNERDAIVQHHIDRLYHKKSQSYLPARSLSTTSSADTVRLEDDEDDFALVSLVNSAPIAPPIARQRLSHDSLDDLGEEGEFLQTVMTMDSDNEDNPIVAPAPLTSNLSQSRVELRHLGLRHAAPDPYLILESRLTPMPLPRVPALPTNSSSSSLASMMTVQLENPALTESPLMPALGLPFKPPPRTEKLPTSAHFYLQCLFGLVGAVSLTIVLVLCIPSLAASMGIVLGATTTKAALGAGLVSVGSFAASGLLFYCRPKQIGKEDLPENLSANNANQV